jgi:hypothetical protein
MSVEVAVVYDDDDVRDFVKIYLRNVRWGYPGLLGALGLARLQESGARGFFDADMFAKLPYALVSFMLAAIVFELVLPWYYRRHFRKTWLLYGEPVLIRLTEEGVCTRSPLGESKLYWNAFRYFRETKQTFLLYIGRVSAVVIPKRCMTPETTDEVRHLLRGNLREVAG